MIPPGPIFLPKGFKFSAVKAGIKASGKLDLALIVAEPKTSAAALFTRNWFGFDRDRCRRNQTMRFDQRGRSVWRIEQAFADAGF